MIPTNVSSSANRLLLSLVAWVLGTSLSPSGHSLGIGKHRQPASFVSFMSSVNPMSSNHEVRSTRVMSSTFEGIPSNVSSSESSAVSNVLDAVAGKQLLIDTPRDEFGAVFTADARTMYFTADAGGQQRIMQCAYSNGTTSVPQEVVLFAGARVRNVGMPSVSGDGQYMVFAALLTDLSGYGRTDLYSARRVRGVWTDIRNLGATVNSSGWDSHPSISADGKRLYFSSDREGGAGGTDIYCCLRTGTTWSKAEPVLGLNTGANEMAPFISPDLRELYFTSDREGGLGGFDLYSSIRSADSVRDVALLPLPFNSTGNEHGICVSACGDVVAVSSDRVGSIGESDVFLFSPSGLHTAPMMVISGEITRTDTSDRVVSWLTVHSLDDAQIETDVRVDDMTGRYTAVVSPGHVYALTSWETDAVVQTRIVRFEESDKGKIRFTGLTQMPCTEGSRIVLPAEFNDESEVMSALTHIELRRMSEIVLAHPEYRLVLQSETFGRSGLGLDSVAVGRKSKALKSYLNLRGLPLGSIIIRHTVQKSPESGAFSVSRVQEELVMLLTKEKPGNE